ncbi:hypothetical protein EV182_003179, partial [Spiromyces aspiralis]
GINGDISFGSTLGLKKNKFMATLAYIDRRVRPLLLTLKAWQNARGLGNSSRGLLNSYCLIMMCLARLMELRVIPPIRCICCLRNSVRFEKVPDKVAASQLKYGGDGASLPLSNGRCLCCNNPLPLQITEDCESHFYTPSWKRLGKAGRKRGDSNDNQDSVKPKGEVAELWRSPNKMSVYDLLMDFFRHYSSGYHYGKHAVSARLGSTKINLGSPLLDSDLHGVRPSRENWRDACLLVVEDPFELNINCGQVQPSVVFGFQYEFALAHHRLKRGLWDEFMSEWNPKNPDNVRLNPWDMYLQYKRMSAWLDELPE